MKTAISRLVLLNGATKSPVPFRGGAFSMRKDYALANRKRRTAVRPMRPTPTQSRTTVEGSGTATPLLDQAVGIEDGIVTVTDRDGIRRVVRIEGDDGILAQLGDAAVDRETRAAEGDSFSSLIYYPQTVSTNALLGYSSWE